MKLLFSCFALALLAEAHQHGDYVIPDEAMVDRVPYEDSEGYSLVGFVSTPPNVTGQVPALIFIHDASGPNDYEKKRATMVSQSFGWVGFAADIFGAQYEETGPGDDRGMLLRTIRNEQPLVFMDRIKAAVDEVTKMPMVDPTKVALAGYCFGGSGVMMFAIDDSSVNNGVAAVVSFHGGLGDHVFEHRNRTAMDEMDETKPKMLVLSGGEDDMSSEIPVLEVTLDSSGNEWEITRYWGIQHAWTVWDDTRGRYNEWADITSWNSMIKFLMEVFGETSFEYDRPGVDGVEAINYTDPTDGAELRGYVARPDSASFQGPHPAVVIVPDWDGVNMYEQERANLFSELGYVGFAADIYGADLQNDIPFQQRIELVGLYRNQNSDLYFSRIQRAIDLVASLDYVDGDNIAILGYCFGGSGVFQYAVLGGSSAKVIGAFHGNFEEENIPPLVGNITGYTMILSGGNDGQHGNQTLVESILNEGNAEWEISRWSDVDHGFTSWSSNAYNLRADYRSWNSFLTAMEDKMEKPVEVSQPASPTDASPTEAPPTDAPPTDAPPTDAPTTESSSATCFPAAILMTCVSIMIWSHI